MTYKSVARSFPFRIITVIIAIALVLSSIPLPAQGLRAIASNPHEIGAGPATAMAIGKPVDRSLRNASSPYTRSNPSSATDLDLALHRNRPSINPNVLRAVDNAVQQQPTSILNPISISRVQSAYRATDAILGSLVITFTITNNQFPSNVAPQLPLSTTITDTINSLLAFDFSNDANTIHNVLVADSLMMNNAEFSSSTPMPDSNDAQYVWNIGDLPPLGSATVTLAVRVPMTVSNFLYLDTGATAWGTIAGRAVKAQSRPASLAPNDIDGIPIGDWLKWTVDADKYDKDMLLKAAELRQDPIAMFEYVRSMGYESYRGSLRGTRGTLWGGAGNSLDKSSLLIAMLRASGIPARYRHGVLDKERAQELILSMFPQTAYLIGNIPVDEAVSDPAGDIKLLGETQDHWWVEAYLPDTGWLDLDPSFLNAVPQQRFVTDSAIATDGTDRIAEVPDYLRHKVTIRLKVEMYDPLGSLSGALATTYPLSVTLNAVELTGNPVTLGHLVNTDFPGRAALFFWVQHAYTPYFLIGRRIIEGQSFQEFASNFPFSNHLVTGEWLVIEQSRPFESTQTSVHEIIDRIGAYKRSTGGQITVAQSSGIAPFTTPIDLTTLIFSSASTLSVFSRNNGLLSAQAIINASLAELQPNINNDKSSDPLCATMCETMNIDKLV